MDERNAWMAHNAERLDQLQAEVLALAGMDEDDPRNRRRLAEIRQELATLERLSKLLEDQPWEP